MADPKDPTVKATETEETPTEESLEEAALDRARAYVAELEAQVALQGELPEAPPEEGAPAARPTRQEADAQAREEFKRLRERSTKKTL